MNILTKNLKCCWPDAANVRFTQSLCTYPLKLDRLLEIVNFNDNCALSEFQIFDCVALSFPRLVERPDQTQLDYYIIIACCFVCNAKVYICKLLKAEG